MMLPVIDTHAAVLDRIQASGLAFTSLTRTLNDLEIVSVRTGGTRQPPIVITAGAHAGEPSGVYGALELLTTLRTEHETHIVPLRDPFAWEGMANCLQFALGEAVSLQSHRQLATILAGRGEIIFRDGDFIIALINHLGFVAMPTPRNTTGPRDIERRLRALLRERSDLVQALQGIRLTFPSNLAGVDGCGDFTQAFTAFVTPEGEVTELNRGFDRADAPTEVQCIKDLVDRVRPGLTIDLHEGQGSKFYLFVSSIDNPTTGRVASAALDAVRQEGAELYTLEELTRRIDRETSARLRETEPGLIVGNTHSGLQGASLGTYGLRYGAVLTTETGRWTSLNNRVAWQVAATHAAVRAFELAV